MRLRNTILMTSALVCAANSADAAKQCMPCANGKWGEDGKCEQDCEAGYYCNGGSKVKCLGGQSCPAGSESPTECPPGQQCQNGIPSNCPSGYVSNAGMKECLPSNSSWTLVQGWSGSGNIGMNGILAGGYTYKIILTGGSGGGDCGSNPSQGAAGGQNTYYVTVPDTVQYSYGIGQGGCDGNKGGRDCGGGGSSYITINGTLYAANGGACGGRTRYAGGTNGRPSYTCDGNVSSGYPMSSGAANTASQNGCDNHGYNGNIAIYRLIG